VHQHPNPFSHYTIRMFGIGLGTGSARGMVGSLYHMDACAPFRCDSGYASFNVRSVYHFGLLFPESKRSGLWRFICPGLGMFAWGPVKSKMFKYRLSATPEHFPSLAKQSGNAKISQKQIKGIAAMGQLIL